MGRKHPEMAHGIASENSTRLATSSGVDCRRWRRQTGSSADTNDGRINRWDGMSQALCYGISISVQIREHKNCSFGVKSCNEVLIRCSLHWWTNSLRIWRQSGSNLTQKMDVSIVEIICLNCACQACHFAAPVCFFKFEEVFFLYQIMDEWSIETLQPSDWWTSSLRVWRQVGSIADTIDGRCVSCDVFFFYSCCICYFVATALVLKLENRRFCFGVKLWD